MYRILAATAFIFLSTQAFAQNYSAEELNRRAIERRAVEAVVWGMPAVNYDLMLQEMLTKTSAKQNEIVYWSRPVDWKNQTLTPNPDALYFMIFFNTKMRGRSLLMFRQQTQKVRLPPTSTPYGRCRWRTPVRSVPTRARVAST